MQGLSEPFLHMAASFTQDQRNLFELVTNGMWSFFDIFFTLILSVFISYHYSTSNLTSKIRQLQSPCVVSGQHRFLRISEIKITY